MSSATEEKGAATARVGLRDLLKNHDFRLLWLGQVISDFGDSLTMLTLLLLVNNLTGSTAALATMMVVLAVPQITLGLVAGVYVDRLDRRRIMIVSDLFRGLFVLGFILAGSREHLWLIYVFGFVQASIGTFFNPSRAALMPRVVSGANLLAANSVTQVSRIIFGLLGTAAAGLILDLTKTYWITFTLDALTFFASVLLVSRIRVNARPEVLPGSTRSGAGQVFEQLKDGMRVIGHTPVLLGTLVAAAVMMLGMGAVNVLIIPLIVNVLQVPVSWFAGMEFAQTSSMVISGAFVAVLAARFRPTNIIGSCMLALGVLIGLLAGVNNVWQLGLILFAAGWLVTPLQAAMATIVQTAVPDDVRGRASAAQNTIVTSANLVSMGLAGVLAQALGLPAVFIIGAVITLLAGAVSFFMFRGKAGSAVPPLEAAVHSPLTEAATD